MKWPGWVLALCVLTVSSLSMPNFVWAAKTIVSPIPTMTEAPISLDASVSAEASAAAETATPAAQIIVQQVTEKKPDVTQPGGEVAGKLERLVLDQPQSPLMISNFLQHGIKRAVAAGVPANTIVLVILFPLVAALIAGARHLIGLRGFGIFTPAVLSVAFVAMGIFAGILLFIVILGVATLAKTIIKWMHLQYLPRMALVLWFVCIGVLAVMLAAPVLDIGGLTTLSIFPILMLVLLAETFIEVQIGKSRREATELTVETIVLALISSLVLSLAAVQRVALLYPEILLTSIAVLDVFMGRYVGLRFTEYRKFKKLVK